MTRPSALCPVCQSQFHSGTCTHVTGTGTPDDPYVFSPIISEQSGNMAECGPGGLGAFTKQIYRDPPACCVYLTVDQPIGWDVVQGIPFNEERFDTDGMHDAEDLGTSNRITVKTPGLYLFTLNVMWSPTHDSAHTGDFAAFIRVNGGKFIALDSFPAGNGDLYAAHSLSVQYPMAAGDWVDAMVKQDVVDEDGEPKVMMVVAERNSPVFAATYLRSISGMTIVGVDTSDLSEESGGGIGNQFNLNGSQTWSTPDSSDIDATSNIDLRAVPALADWTPATEQFLVSKGGGASQLSYGLSVYVTSGKLRLHHSSNGTGWTATESTVAPTVSDGSILAVRAVMNSSGLTVTFYTKATIPATAEADIESDSGWTQLGTPVGIANGSIFSSTSSLRAGSHLDSGGNPVYATGNLYAIVVKNNGTLVACPDFYHNNTPFTDDCGHLWAKT